MTRACVVLSTILLVTCRTSRPAEKRSPPEWAFAGCSRVERGPVCRLPRGEEPLRLWIATAAPRRVSVEIDGAEVQVEESVATDGGVRLRARAPAGARLLVVRAADGGPVALRLAPPWDDPLAEVGAARRRGALDEAERLASTIESASEEDRELRARVAGVRGRIDRQRGERRLAGERLRRAASELRELGTPSLAVPEATALAHFLRAEHRYGEVRRALDAVEALAVHDPENAAMLLYHRGVTAVHVGDLASALDYFHEARRDAERLDIVFLLRSLPQLEARALANLGRFDEAEARIAGVDAAGWPPCARASLSLNLGWNRLLRDAASRSTRSGPPARVPLVEAHELYRACDDGLGGLQHARMNLALEALHRGAIEEARDWLDESDDDDAPDVLAWRLDVRGRVALAEARAEDALATFDELALRASVAGAPEFEWRAAVGRARALVALGRRDEAALALERAEIALDEAATHMPFVDGAVSYLDARAESTSLLIALQLERGDAASALGALRRARARLLSVVAARASRDAVAPSARERAFATYHRMREESEARRQDAWQLPLDELRALEEEVARERTRDVGALRGLFASMGALHADLAEVEEGDLTIALHDLQDRAVAMARHGERTWVVAAPHGERERVASALLHDLLPAIETSRRVRVIATGEWSDVDVHALEIGGLPLIERRAVVYATDVAAAARPQAAHGALAVIDPVGDLPGAARELDAVRAPVTARGPALSVLRGAGATWSAVMAELPEVEHFHFAGHGHFEGWESGLVLAEHQRLTMGDVLSLRAVPEVVVLSGCAGSRLVAGDSALGIGVAQAFVLRGARLVVASDETVSDEDTAAWIETLYEAYAERGDWLLAFTEAQRRGAREARSETWRAFRAWVP